MKCRKCRAGELICRAFFFSFQFAYHLLHLPLLTPEGLRGDFDLNRKSRVVGLRISSSLYSAGKTLELCLDSETSFTSVQVQVHGSPGGFKEVQSDHQIPELSFVGGQTQVETLRADLSPKHHCLSISSFLSCKRNVKAFLWEPLL